MPAPLVIAAAAVPARRLAPATFAALLGLLALGLVLVMGVFGAFFGLAPLQGGHQPSAGARAEIPALYLRLYQDAGRRYGVDPWVLAGIGSVESRHGRSHALGVHSGVNAYGCCAGPMQFSVVGASSTWDAYGVDGDGDGRRSPYDPADAIPAAARYLRASGAPENYRAALFAYNHADWYVAAVLAQASLYRGALPGGGAGPAIDPATLRGILANPRIVLTLIQQADLRAGGIDSRLISTLSWIGRHHTVVITALRADHHPGTNHEAGRAMDIGAVDGEICRGTRTGRCAGLVRELASIKGPLRSTELIYCWDPDGPGDPRLRARRPLRPHPLGHGRLGSTGRRRARLPERLRAYDPGLRGGADHCGRAVRRHRQLRGTRAACAGSPSMHPHARARLCRARRHRRGRRSAVARRQRQLHVGLRANRARSGAARIRRPRALDLYRRQRGERGRTRALSEGQSPPRQQCRDARRRADRRAQPSAARRRRAARTARSRHAAERPRAVAAGRHGRVLEP
jgi:hypothetical protein